MVTLCRQKTSWIFRELIAPQMACQRFRSEGYREKPQNCREVRMIFRCGAEWGSCPCQAKHFVPQRTFYPSRESLWVLGRSLQDLVVFPNDLPSKQTNLYLHKQGINTTTPGGKLLLQLLGVFAKFERNMIVKRVKAGLKRARAEGKVLRRPRVSAGAAHSVTLDGGSSRSLRPSVP